MARERDMAPGLLANLIIQVVEEYGAYQPILAAWDLAIVASRTKGMDSATIRKIFRTNWHPWSHAPNPTDVLYDRLVELGARREASWDRLEWERDEEGSPIWPQDFSWVGPLKRAARRDASAKLWYEAAREADEILTDRAVARHERWREERR